MVWVDSMEISILVVTYNHERFVRQALDSVIMQNISVPYEILILDDASTDNTPEILKEYKRKYPQITSLYLRKTNSAHPTRNGYFLLSKAKGRFYAFIEGDDYWTDSLKIQKQYDFLRQHEEFSGCMTDFITVDKENKKIESSFYDKKEDHVYSLDDFRKLRAMGMTVTFFARNYFEPEDYRIVYKADKMMGDITTYMLCLLKGNIYQLDDITSAYRYVCKDGENNFNSIHQGNIYRNYMIARYWIRLENYMKRFDKRFEFIPLGDFIEQISPEYSIKSILNLIMQSKNKKNYLLIYFVSKFLKDSNFLLEEVKDRKNKKQYRWDIFKKDKKPIILFGAGAAAAEYLDKYAWKENILFIVDNDTAKQNTSYKGYLVKNPREIMKYKNGASILIVNKKHERNIEIQLRNMGIQSYYCYCTMQSNRLRHIIANKIFKCCKKNDSL